MFVLRRYESFFDLRTLKKCKHMLFMALLNDGCADDADRAFFDI